MKTMHTDRRLHALALDNKLNKMFILHATEKYMKTHCKQTHETRIIVFCIKRLLKIKSECQQFYSVHQSQGNNIRFFFV